MTSPAPDLSKLRIDRSAPPPNRPRKTWLIGGGVVAAIVMVAAWFLFSDGPLPVQVVVAMPMDQGAGAASNAGAIAVTANGYVVARTRAAVAAKVPGRLAMLNVSEGSFVREGALIARLENADYLASVEEARANLASARATLVETTEERDQAQREAQRLETIRAGNQNLTSQQDIDAAQSRAATATARMNAAAARVEAAQASLRYAEATLENTFIRAPFTGTVLRKEAEVGEVVAPSVGGGLTRGAVVTMADLSTLEVEVDVNEAYIGRVTRGQEGRITLDAYPDTSFRGTVRQVVPTADRQRATVQVKVAIVDRDPRILPEMGSRVDFIAPEPPRQSTTAAADAPPRFRVPQDAVRTESGNSIVWIVRDGRLESRAVDAGPVSAGFREIRRGLLGGEQILVSGVESPTTGLKVVVTPAGAPSP